MKAKPEYLAALSVLAVASASAKFLLDGASISIFGSPINFGHIDPTAYAAFLTPILAAHGYVHTQVHKINHDFKELRDDDKN